MMISKVPIGDVLDAPEFPALIAQYAAESAVEGMPPVDVKMETYRLLELTGQLHTFWAEHAGEMVGFITVAVQASLHFGAPLAVTESFFVAEGHRKGGTGLKLLAAAEGIAKQLGAPGLFVCAPNASRLIEVLPRRGYRQTNAVFFKGFASVH